MTDRLLPESDKSFCDAVSILDANTWPSDLPPEYGETELRSLCIRFALKFGETKTDYRQYKNSQGQHMPVGLKRLLNSINTLPISTAECERGFSKMNILCSPLRSRLTVQHLSALMFISICGPSLEFWQPLPFVKSWLTSGNRNANYMRAPCAKPNLEVDEKRKSLWQAMN